MKEASKIMYTIGKIFNIIGLVITSLTLVLPIILIAMPDEIYKQQKTIDGTKLSVEQIQALGVGTLVAVIIGIVLLIVALCLASYAKRKLNNNTREIAPHVIMIIVGVFASIFYLIGGILGLVAEEQEKEKTE